MENRKELSSVNYMPLLRSLDLQIIFIAVLDYIKENFTSMRRWSMQVQKMVSGLYFSCWYDWTTTLEVCSKQVSIAEQLS